jgi:hypothetical protein
MERLEVLTYMSSYLSLLGGFFFVDLCNSDATFLLRRTSTSAENIDNDTLVSSTVKGSTTFSITGRGVAARWGVAFPLSEVKREEKKPPVPVGFDNFSETGRGFCFFSDPEE